MARGFIPVGLRSRPRLWHHAYSNRTNQPDGAAAQPSGDKSPHHKNKGTFSRLENRSKRTSTCHTGRLRLIRHRSLCSWLCGPLLWRGSLLPLECEALIAFLGPLRDPAGASSLATKAKAPSTGSKTDQREHQPVTPVGYIMGCRAPHDGDVQKRDIFS